ncbi:unnamed protein product [Allacma fusca]|uniref:Reelin domain-containing protein n=1 Tax=Allacma fusca TaxID=39272 RepID=A0A8J2P9K0_9HEXA|nr:unnamed protein product [Allacma fusca]
MKLNLNYILIINFFISISKQVLGNPMGLCKFPNIPVHSFEDEDSVCVNMAPRNGRYPPENSPCPWKIFTFDRTIRPSHIQPVTLGSTDGAKIFDRYIIKALPLNKTYGREFLGHFEPQWDAEPVCCNGVTFPNMLVSSKVRPANPNETVLWTAPRDYLGDFVFIVTFAISSRKYWFSERSDVVTVVPDCPTCIHPSHPDNPLV